MAMSKHGVILFACGLSVSCAEPTELPLDETNDETADALERYDVGAPSDAAEEGEADGAVESVGIRSRGRGHVRLQLGSTHAGEQAHAGSSIEVPVDPLAGEPCETSSACEMGTQCVADEIGSDGAFRCLTVCVDPTAENADSIKCIDDAGCCDDAAVCDDQGTCVVPGGGGGSGGSDPAADGQGCNEGCDFDRDDDGVVNSLDANPDQSCSADADQDGIRDSCDANDMSDDDGCFGCAIPLVRTNGLAWVYALILISLRRRRPRRARPR